MRLLKTIIRNFFKLNVRKFLEFINFLKISSDGRYYNDVDKI